MDKSEHFSNSLKSIIYQMKQPSKKISLDERALLILSKISKYYGVTYSEVIEIFMKKSYLELNQSTTVSDELSKETKNNIMGDFMNIDDNPETSHQSKNLTRNEETRTTIINKLETKRLERQIGHLKKKVKLFDDFETSDKNILALLEKNKDDFEFIINQMNEATTRAESALNDTLFFISESNSRIDEMENKK